jgi:hypothetical protein
MSFCTHPTWPWWFIWLGLEWCFWLVTSSSWQVDLQSIFPCLGSNFLATCLQIIGFLLVNYIMWPNQLATHVKVKTYLPCNMTLFIHVSLCDWVLISQTGHFVDLTVNQSSHHMLCILWHVATSYWLVCVISLVNNIGQCVTYFIWLVVNWTSMQSAKWLMWLNIMVVNTILLLDILTIIGVKFRTFRSKFRYPSNWSIVSIAHFNLAFTTRKHGLAPLCTSTQIQFEWNGICPVPLIMDYSESDMTMSPFLLCKWWGSCHSTIHRL